MDQIITVLTSTSPEFLAKLAKAKAEMVNPKRKSDGQVGKRAYKYADLAETLDSVEPALESSGLVLLQPTADVAAGVVRVMSLVIDKETGSMYVGSASSCVVEDAQKMGSWITYLRRYTLTSMFSLAVEDDDGDATKRSPDRAKNKPDTDDSSMELSEGEYELNPVSVRQVMKDPGGKWELWRANFSDGTWSNFFSGDVLDTLREAAQNKIAVSVQVVRNPKNGRLSTRKAEIL